MKVNWWAVLAIGLMGVGAYVVIQIIIWMRLAVSTYF